MEGEDIVVHYEMFDKKDQPGPCIKLNDDGSYSIMDYSQIKVSTMSITVFYKDAITIDKRSLFYCLKCMNNVSQKDRFPDGVISSIRWGNMCKGRSGKSFAVIMADVWMGGNRTNVKISESNIHIVGVKCMQGALTIFEIIKNALEDAAEFWEDVVSNKELFLEASLWIQPYSKKSKTKSFANHGDGIYQDYEILWPRVPKTHEHVYFANEIIKRYSDLIYVSEIDDRTHEILTSHRPVSDTIEFDNMKRVMVNLTYSISNSRDQEVDLETLTRCLCEKGYSAGMHTSKKKEILINIYDENVFPDDNEVKKKEDKLFEQGITITSKGKIRHTGSGGQRQRFWYKKLMTDIVTIIG